MCERSLVYKMNRYQKLLSNTIIFTIGNLGSKLMQFIMVPLYSYTLTTDEFGKTDIITTVVSLLAPIISLEMFDAVFRFAMDKNTNKKQVFGTGFIATLICSLIVITVSTLLKLLFGFHYWILGSSILIATVFYSLISNYIRALGHSKVFAIAGMVNTFFMASLNIALLVWLKLGISGYLWSMLVGTIAATLFILICVPKLWSQMSPKYFNLVIFRKMLVYGLPLIPNSLAWWMNSASDRLFILSMVGFSANGIYAMANKIPNFMTMVTNIFFQSWQISAVEEYNSKDAEQFISRIFSIFMYIMLIGSVGILMFIKPLFKVMINSSYFIGWELTPFILLALVYSSLSGFLGTIYTATKRTGPIFVTTVIGAIVNVIFSIILIKYLGILGAALANVISFMVVMIIRYHDLRREQKISVNIVEIGIIHALYFGYTGIILLNKNQVVIFLTGLALVSIITMFKWSVVMDFIRNRQ